MSLEGHEIYSYILTKINDFDFIIERVQHLISHILHHNEMKIVKLEESLVKRYQKVISMILLINLIL